MANQTNVKFDLSAMDDLIKSLSSGYFIRVGIIGAKATKAHPNKEGKGDKTNAEIGTFHEFGGKSKYGKDQPPRRSFLADSLKFKIRFDRPEMVQIKKAAFKYMFLEKNPKKFLADLGSKCLDAIKQGFETNGFGMWKPLASLKTIEARYDKSIKGYQRVLRKMLKGKMAYDKSLLDNYINEAQNPHILTDTGKLRKSISFKIMKRKG